jgi:hypothetical protein
LSCCGGEFLAQPPGPHGVIQPQVRSTIQCNAANVLRTSLCEMDFECVCRLCCRCEGCAVSVRKRARMGVNGAHARRASRVRRWRAAPVTPYRVLSIEDTNYSNELLRTCC